MAGTRTIIRLVLLAVALAGCRRGAVVGAGLPAPAAQPADVVAPAPSATDSVVETPLGRLYSALSERSGTFPSDNVVSNETSYLHVADALRRIGVTGGAYIGVGPDQNYSYIAAIRPTIAFMFDIRRENAMEHLLFKAAFAMARNRLEYLCIVTGRPPPANLELWTDHPLWEMIAYIDQTPSDKAYADSTLLEIQRRVATFGIPIESRDRSTVALYRSAFVRDGMNVQYSSLAQRVQFGMPGWRSLMEATDRSGRPGHFLAADSTFRLIQTMHARDLIVPVTGNVSGPKAFAAVGEEIRRRGESVSALYMSNVEQYITRDGSYPRFIDNVRSLPRTRASVIIRSLFGQGYGVHPLSVPGHQSTSMLQFIDSLLEEWDAGRITSYADVVFRGYIPR